MGIIKNLLEVCLTITIYISFTSPKCLHLDKINIRSLFCGLPQLFRRTKNINSKKVGVGVSFEEVLSSPRYAII